MLNTKIKESPLSLMALMSSTFLRRGNMSYAQHNSSHASKLSFKAIYPEGHLGGSLHFNPAKMVEQVSRFGS